MQTKDVQLPLPLMKLLGELQTEQQDWTKAIYNLIGLYIGEKLTYWEKKNQEFAQKWRMDFKDFEQTRYDMPQGNSYEMDTEYMDWNDTISALSYYQQLKQQWTQTLLSQS